MKLLKPAAEDVRDGIGRVLDPLTEPALAELAGSLESVAKLATADRDAIHAGLARSLREVLWPLVSRAVVTELPIAGLTAADSETRWQERFDRLSRAAGWDELTAIYPALRPRLDTVASREPDRGRAGANGARLRNPVHPNTPDDRFGVRQRRRPSPGHARPVGAGDRPAAKARHRAGSARAGLVGCAAQPGAGSVRLLEVRRGRVPAVEVPERSCRCRLAECGDREKWLALAVSCALRLRAAATVDRSGAHWATSQYPQGLGGLAHGAAGIGWALARLNTQVPDADSARQLADAAFRWQETLYQPDQLGWRDLRQSEEVTCMQAWCDGAVGMG